MRRDTARTSPRFTRSARASGSIRLLPVCRFKPDIRHLKSRGLGKAGVHRHPNSHGLGLDALEARQKQSVAPFEFDEDQGEGSLFEERLSAVMADGEGMNAAGQW